MGPPWGEIQSPVGQQAFRHALEDLIAAFASLNLRDRPSVNTLIRCGWLGRKMKHGRVGKVSAGDMVTSGDQRNLGHEIFRTASF